MNRYELLEKGNEYRNTLLDRSSGEIGGCPVWHGWVIMEAYLKGYYEAEDEIKRLEQWVNDCQAGMYINCVYCGHRYGPEDKVKATMQDVLKEHIEKCPKHPLFEAKLRINKLEEKIKILKRRKS